MLRERLQVKKLIKDDMNDEDISELHLFNIQFLGEGYNILESKDLADLARKWEERKTAKSPCNMYKDRIKEIRKNRKIKIGYLSADFNSHPVGRFMLPILKNHKKEEFEIYLISSTKMEDDMTKKIKLECLKWIDIFNLDDISSARLIAELGLDILVELGGYTAESRLGIMCYRPCAVQLSYLGYFAPTYLKCIDAWLGDKILFKNLSKIHKESHKLREINGGYMTLPETEEINISEGAQERFVFGSFNHARKLSVKAIELFAKLIKETNSILLLKSISFKNNTEQKRIKEAFKKEGIMPNQIEIISWKSSHREHMECYNMIDVAIDPFPYSGATTTCEALYMGVPVITLSGNKMVNNLSASILHYANLGHLIANNEDDFIRIGRALKESGKRNKKERQQLSTY